MIGTTITQFLIEEQRKQPQATGDLTAVINDVVTACKTISSAMRYGALSDDDLLGVSGEMNVQGETQKTLDIVANDLFLQRTEFGGHVASMVSEEMESPYELPEHYPKGRYLLLYDPVDGSANISENASIGTIFSILKRPGESSGHPDIGEFLQPGSQQICAGYAVYGPASMIVMSIGNGTNGFTLDPLVGEFILSHPNIRIPDTSPRLFINAAGRRLWEPAIRRFVDERLEGTAGSAGRDADFRWSAGAVADVHRLLMSGGLYLNPPLKRDDAPGSTGKLRLLYEVNPLSLLVEQAGGCSNTGSGRALEVIPDSLHQRSPVFMGSGKEVEGLIEILSPDNHP